MVRSVAWNTHLVPGAIFAGDYRILSSLASGGMGAVFVAEQLSTGHRRALKVMHPELFEDERSRARFTHEAKVGGKIESVHIVECVAAGVDPQSGIPWMAMELLEGETLKQLVERRGPLPPGEVAVIFEQIGHGLGRAHAQGVIHLDLKPANLFMARTRSRDGGSIVKILDFGISKMIADNASKAAVTSTIASPLWMSPEQAEHGAQIGPTSDVWSLGLLAYYLLTGQPFWERIESALALTKEVFLEPIPAAIERAGQRGHQNLIPAGFDTWLSRCLDRDAGRRYPNAEEAVLALRPVLRSSTPSPRVRQSGSPGLISAEYRLLENGDLAPAQSAPIQSAPIAVDAALAGPEGLFEELERSVPVPHRDRVVGQVSGDQLAALAAKQTVLAAPKKSREELMADLVRMEAKQRRIRILSVLLVALSIVAFIMVGMGVWVFFQRL